MSPSPAISAQLIERISELITQSRQQIQRQVNTCMVHAYWHIGCLIVEEEQQGRARAAYGQAQLQQLAKALSERFGKGFDVRNLRNMRAFYLAFPNRNALRSDLSWTHYRALLRVDDAAAREWYLNESAANHWSSRALERQINVLYYERLLASSDRSPVIAEAQHLTQELADDPRQHLRDPYILDFLNLPSQRLMESDLEQAIIHNLQHFLLELGKGFAFVERQQRIRTEDQDFYIDLVFYNFKLKCFVLIDLKLGKLNHQDVGQMDTYRRIYDQDHRGPDDNPTLGLILCSQKSEAVVKYSILNDNQQLFAAKYLSYLPTEDELRRELERERREIQARLENSNGD